jgi:hypothetical protein
MWMATLDEWLMAVFMPPTRRVAPRVGSEQRGLWEFVLRSRKKMSGSSLRFGFE